MARKDYPTVEYLRECFDVDFEAGTLTWRVRPVPHFVDVRAHKIWNTRYSNKRADTHITFGCYRSVQVNTIRIGAHIVIYALYHNKYPTYEIDHIDRNPTNNSIHNLRDTKYNQLNRKLSKNSTSGVSGITWVKRRSNWVVRIKVNDVYLYLGHYDNLLDAVAARLNGERRIHRTLLP